MRDYSIFKDFEDFSWTHFVKFCTRNWFIKNSSNFLITITFKFLNYFKLDWEISRREDSQTLKIFSKNNFMEQFSSNNYLDRIDDSTNEPNDEKSKINRWRNKVSLSHRKKYVRPFFVKSKLLRRRGTGVNRGKNHDSHKNPSFPRSFL